MDFLASNKPYNSLDLLNNSVSGEFKYLGSPLVTMRPPKPITSPLTFLIGNITRSRKRS